MDDADYMSPKELVDWLTVYAPPKAADAAKRLLDSAEAASKEVVRLQKVIEDHSRKLSAPVASQYYSADLTTELNPQLCTTETRIRLRPMLHEIRVPFAVGGWTDDFKRAFCDQVATEVGHVAGRRLAKELWPNAPTP